MQCCTTVNIIVYCSQSKLHNIILYDDEIPLRFDLPKTVFILCGYYGLQSFSRKLLNAP